jgi:hypothetical protein
MKSQQGHGTSTQGSDGARRSALGPEVTTAWIEELTPAREVRVFPARHRRIGGKVILVLSFVAAGILGRAVQRDGLPSVPQPADQAVARQGASSAGPSEGSRGWFELVSPTDGEDIGGAVLRVRGVASRDLGQLHLSVVLGDAVLGWTNVDVTAEGPLDTGIRIFAPLFHAAAELRVEGAGAGLGAVSLRRPISLSPRGVVQLWSAETRLVGAHCVLVVDGVAPLTVASLRMQVRGRDHGAVADVVTPNGIETSVAGSAGGRLLGVGGFHALVPVAGWALGEDLVLTASWTDHGISDSPRTVEVAIGPFTAC